MLDAEALDVVNDLLRQVVLVGTVLYARTLQPRYPPLVEDGVHCDDAFEFSGQWGEIIFGQDTCGAGGFQRVGRQRVPAAKHDVAQTRQ